jgi:hypothetical protein
MLSVVRNPRCRATAFAGTVMLSILLNDSSGAALAFSSDRRGIVRFTFCLMASLPIDERRSWIRRTWVSIREEKALLNAVSQHHFVRSFNVLRSSTM